MEKPDLINHVRFADPDPNHSKKAKIPSANTLKKELNKKYTFTATKKSKKDHKRKTKGASFYNDGLKYMNNREDLLSLMEAKKTKDSRIAYKVTECYPEGWPRQE